MVLKEPAKLLRPCDGLHTRKPVFLSAAKVHPPLRPLLLERRGAQEKKESQKKIKKREKTAAATLETHGRVLHAQETRGVTEYTKLAWRAAGSMSLPHQRRPSQIEGKKDTRF